MQKMTKQLYHEYDIEVHVHSIAIEIKFPCTLSCAFKIGKDQSRSTQQVKLTQGKASFQQSIVLRSSIRLKETEYENKKGFITIYVFSNSGRNIAGMCTLDMVAYLKSESLIDKNLERCPDLKARIKVSIKPTFIRQYEVETFAQGSEQNRTSWKGSEDAKSVSVKSFKIQQKRVGSTMNINLQRFNNTNGMRNLTPKNESLWKSGVSSDNITKTIQMNDARVEYFSNKGSSQERSSTNERNNDRERKYADELERNRIISQLRLEVTEKDRKLTRFQVEKQAHMREIENLRSQVQTVKTKMLLKNNTENQLNSEVERLRKKLATAEANLDQLRLMKLEWEKKELERKTGAATEKVVAEELESKTSQLVEAENEINMLKKTREELDKLSKQKMREVRQQSQRIDDLENALATTQKRLEMKDGFYKDELKKYNQRVVEIDADKQRVYSELEELRRQLEEQQKRYNATLREKDRAASDQKNKLNRRIENLKTQLEMYNKQNTSKGQQYATLQDRLEKLTRCLSEKEESVRKLEIEVERANSELENASLYRVKYQEQLKEKNLLRQQMLAKQTDFEGDLAEVNRQKQELQNFMSERNQTIRQLNQKISELSRKSKEKDTRLAEAQSLNQSLNKKYQLLRRADERKAIEIVELKNTEKLLQGEISQFFNRQQELQNRILEMNGQHEESSEELRNVARRLNQQTEQLRSRLRMQTLAKEKLEDLLKSVSERASHSSDASIRLQDQVKKLELQLLQKNLQQSSLSEDIKRMTTAVADQKQLLKKQAAKQEQLYKRITELETQSIRLGFASEQVLRLQRSLKEKEAENKARVENETQLQINVQRLENSLNHINEELKSKNADLSRERLSNEQQRKELNAISEAHQNLKRQLESRNQELADLHCEAKRLAVQKKVTQDRLTSSLQQFKRSRIAIAQALRVFISDIFRVNEVSSSKRVEISYYEADNQIYSIQQDLAGKIAKLKEKNKQQNNQRQQELRQSYEDQMTKLRKEAQDRYNQIYMEIGSKSQEFHYVRETLRLKNQELASQIEYLHKQLGTLDEQYQQLQAEKESLDNQIRKDIIQIQELRALNQESQREIESLKSEIKELAAEVQNQRKAREEGLARFKSEKELARKQSQSTEKNLQEELYSLQKTLNQKVITIEEHVVSIKNLGKQNEGHQQTIKNLETIIDNLKASQAQKDEIIRQYGRREKELLEKMRNIEQKLAIEEEKVVQLRSGLGIAQMKDREIEEYKNLLQKERQTSLKKISALSNHINQLQQEHHRVVSCLQYTQQDLSRVQQNLAESHDSIRNLEEQLRRKEQRQQQKTSEQIALKDKLARLQAQILNTNSKNKERVEEYQITIQNLTKEKHELTERNIQLDSNLRREVSAKTSGLSSAEKEISRLKSNNQKLQVQLGTTVEELRISNEKEESLKRKLGQQNEEKADLFNRLTESTQELKRLQEYIQQKERENTALFKKLQTIEEDLHATKVYYEGKAKTEEGEAIQALKNQIARMDKGVKELEENLLFHESENNILKQRTNSLEDILERFKGEKEFLYKQLKEQGDKINELTRQKVELERICESKANGMLQVKTEQLEERNSLIKELQSRRQVIKKLEDERAANLKGMKQAAKKAEDAETRLKQSIARYESDIKELVKAKSKLIADVEKAHIELKSQKESVQKHYEKLIRDAESQKSQKIREFEQKIKTIQKEKFQEDALMKVQVHALKDQIRQMRGEPTTVDSSIAQQYSKQVGKVNMKLFLAEEPLKNVQELVPELINKCQENQKLILEQEEKIKQLTQKLGEQNANNQGPKTSRVIGPVDAQKHRIHSSTSLIYASPTKVQKEATVKVNGKVLVEKLKQTEVKIRIAMERVEDLTSDCKHAVEDKIRLLAKTKEVYDLLQQPGDPIIIKDQIQQILGFSATLGISVRSSTTIREYNNNQSQSQQRIVNIPSTPTIIDPKNYIPFIRVISHNSPPADHRFVSSVRVLEPQTARDHCETDRSEASSPSLLLKRFKSEQRKIQTKKSIFQPKPTR